MSKLTIVLCAVLFSSVAFVSSQREIIQEKLEAGLTKHDEVSAFIYVSGISLMSYVNVVADTFISYTTLFNHYYNEQSALGNVDYCKPQHMELQQRSQGMIASSGNCIREKVNNTITRINDNKRQFSLYFDSIIPNANNRKAQESVSTLTIKNAENKETTILNNTFLAETTNLLNSIQYSFGESLVECVHDLTSIF